MSKKIVIELNSVTNLEQAQRLTKYIQYIAKEQKLDFVGEIYIHETASEVASEPYPFQVEEY